MRNTLVYPFFIIVFFLWSLFFRPPGVKAQTCTGISDCWLSGTALSCAGGPKAGQDCLDDRDCPGSFCKEFPWCDSANTTTGWCSLSGASCTPGCPAGYCVVSDNCSYIPGPTPTPPPGGGNWWGCANPAACLGPYGSFAECDAGNYDCQENSCPGSCSGGGGGNQLPTGYHDAYGYSPSDPDPTIQPQANCAATGWATDPDNTSVDLTVRVLENGVEKLQTVAGNFRGDLTGVCPGGTCQFFASLWGIITPNLNRSITSQARDAQTGAWANLNFTPRDLYCSAPPTCTISGATTIAIGDSASYTAIGFANPNGDANLEIDYNTSQSVTGSTRIGTDGNAGGECAGVQTNCNITRVFTPSATVPHYVFCRAYDAARRECRPFGPYVSPSDVDCDPDSTPDVPPQGADFITVNVTDPKGWWQVKDADVTTNGSLISLIPSTCTLPTCNPVFDLNGTGGYPGVPSYGGAATYDFAAGAASSGTVSSKGWLVKSTYLGSSFDYEFFESLIPPPPDVQVNEITPNGQSVTINQGYFSSQGSQSPDGYYWFHHEGDLRMSGEPNLGVRKAIVLVEGGDLYIDGRISITDGQGFFMAIVGKDATGARGNIIVDGVKVSHPNQVEIEGMFFAEGQFKTGKDTGALSDQDQLHIRGSVAALGGIVLERDLGTDNNDTPAELFEYAPDFLFTYPRELTKSGLVWREVAP